MLRSVIRALLGAGLLRRPKRENGNRTKRLLHQVGLHTKADAVVGRGIGISFLSEGLSGFPRQKTG